MKIIKLKRKKESVEEIVKDTLVEDSWAARKNLFAEQLRNNPTTSEILFCQLLDSLKIRYEFQPVVCGYIPDFLFPNHGRRILEVDGSSHKGRKAYDQRRDEILRKHGHKVLRVRANRIFWDTDLLIHEIKAFLHDQGIRRKTRKKLRGKMGRYQPLPPDETYEAFLFTTDGL